VHELLGSLEKGDRLIEVDDVDAAALGEHVPLHLGVPSARLMPEVDPGLQEFSYAHDLLYCTLQDLLPLLLSGGYASARTSQSSE
jgi:hypothetical protein